MDRGSFEIEDEKLLKSGLYSCSVCEGTGIWRLGGYFKDSLCPYCIGRGYIKWIEKLLWEK